MIIKKLFLILSLTFFFYSNSEKTVMQSTMVATAGILATQVGMYLYYAGTKATEIFLYENKEKLFVYVVAHFALNYLFFAALKPVKLRV